MTPPGTDAQSEQAGQQERAANAGQAEAWNGETGQHWVENRDRREASLRTFLPHLLTAARIAPDAQVLDVGCGCGETTLLAARQAAKGHALGADLSAPMLAEARRRAEAEALANVTFTQADAQTHLFEPGGFDAAISRFGVMFFDDPGAAFGNLARALRPGGRLAFLCWRAQEANEFYTLPRQALAPFLALPEPAAPGEPGPFALSGPDRVRGLLTAAGLDTIELTAVDEPMRVGDDVEDAVEYQLSTPVNRSALAATDEPTRDLASDALREALRPHATNRGVELSGSAWLVTAHKP